ncbi:MAG: hypothetical protein ACPGYS_04550 [Flavobacteriales bacterium]
MADIKTYWNGDRHDDNPTMKARQERLSAEVPGSGSAEHIAVDCWREVQNIYYDLFNNGGWNLVTTRYDGQDIEYCDEDELDLDGLEYRMRAVEKFMGEDSWRCSQLRDAAILCARDCQAFYKDDYEISRLEDCIDSFLDICYINRFGEETEATK